MIEHWSRRAPQVGRSSSDHVLLQLSVFYLFRKGLKKQFRRYTRNAIPSDGSYPVADRMAVVLDQRREQRFSQRNQEFFRRSWCDVEGLAGSS
jgi:hypothetical protein